MVAKQSLSSTLTFTCDIFFSFIHAPQKCPLKWQQVLYLLKIHHSQPQLSRFIIQQVLNLSSYLKQRVCDHLQMELSKIHPKLILEGNAIHKVNQRSNFLVLEKSRDTIKSVTLQTCLTLPHLLRKDWIQFCNTI